jgi:tRNA (cytidine/uridine-2'-O-)-methyltransferase
LQCDAKSPGATRQTLREPRALALNPLLKATLTPADPQACAATMTNPVNDIEIGACPSPSGRLEPASMVDPQENAAAPPLRLALFEPDIPQNAGTLFRLAACLGVPVEFVEASDRNLRRAGLDYLGHLALTRHLSFAHFEEFRRRAGLRLVLATTRGAIAHHAFTFRPGDIVMLGRESAGATAAVHAAAEARIAIPLRSGLRSLNVAVAGAMILGEALRQLDAFPAPAEPARPDFPQQDAPHAFP